MKLLYCPLCENVFKLGLRTRSCDCGSVVGRYEEDGHSAVSNGRGISLGLSNVSLREAVEVWMQTPYGVEVSFRRTQVAVWVRANDGPQNPRSRVDPYLEVGK